VPAVQDKAVLVVSESSHSQPARRNEYARQGSESESDVCVAQSWYYYLLLSPAVLNHDLNIPICSLANPVVEEFVGL
jgi:hypothetical protein